MEDKLPKDYPEITECLPRDYLNFPKHSLGNLFFTLWVILHLHEGTSMFTLRSKSPMTPSTSPAPPTNPMDSSNNKDASIATIKD